MHGQLCLCGGGVVYISDQHWWWLKATIRRLKGFPGLLQELEKTVHSTLNFLLSQININDCRTTQLCTDPLNTWKPRSAFPRSALYFSSFWLGGSLLTWTFHVTKNTLLHVYSEIYSTLEYVLYYIQYSLI